MDFSKALCCTKSKTLNVILCCTSTAIGYYFFHILIFYLGTIMIYDRSYDMQTGCPKNVAQCNDSERLSCYNGQPARCFRYGTLFALVQAPIVYIIITVSIWLVLLIIRCSMTTYSMIHREFEEYDETTPLVINLKEIHTEN